MKKIHNVLWTGGWDSTFRVLDLVFNKGKRVQPYYVKDTSRMSTNMELKTMEKIKKMVEYKRGNINDILPTIIIDINNIPEDPEITNSYKELASTSFLGSQYDWLTRWTRSLGIDDLELCVHVDDNLKKIIGNELYQLEEDGEQIYKIRSDNTIKDKQIFSYYIFPIVGVSKIGIEQIAKKSGFEDIMEETWFCHSPINNKPCGMCNPCKYTRNEGLGRRVPEVTILLKSKRMYQRINKKLTQLLKVTKKDG